jgi:trehalose 6-phosphate synthase
VPILPANVDRSALTASNGRERTSKRGRLVVISNRVADLSTGHQTGGLAVALAETLAATGGLWFGWSGDVTPDAHLRPLQTGRAGEVKTVTIALTPEEHESYYLGFANRCLWPLFHYRLDVADLRTGPEAIYSAVNKRFAQQVAPLLEPDDTIWVHDYQLIPFAAYLRQLNVTSPIGFFLHIPFPSPEILAALPGHKQFARTFFGYDLVGFQTVRDRENFARYAAEHLGCRRLNDGRLKGFGRTLAIDAFPIGIDAENFAAEAERNLRSPELRTLAKNADSQHLVVGVDRLDYSKGLPERTRGIEKLLESWPAYHGRVQFLQIAPPTREGVEAYDAIRGELERLTSHVNGRFGDLSWTPIRYVHRPVARETLAGLFRRCRMGLVTPLRDGMNLVAKEYVAAQDPNDPGVLVLSEFAGAAEQLEEALLVNPHDPISLATAMRRGLEMPLGERRARHRALWSRITEQDVTWWRERYLSALAKANVARKAGAEPPARSLALPEPLTHERKSDPAAR